VNIISALVDTVTRLVVQELLEGEQADYLGGRGRYERRGEGQLGVRNGYERGRLRTAEGAIDVAVPQVRDSGEPFRSSLMSFLDGNSEVLERLVTEMYARGLSTRDVEDAFRDATGELLISKSAVSEITDGASPRTGASTCCTSPSGTRSPRPAGVSSSVTCSTARCGCRPRSPPTAHPD
jgi:putative transposase